MWVAKTKIFIIWSCTEKVYQPLRYILETTAIGIAKSIRERKLGYLNCGADLLCQFGLHISGL